MATKYEYYDADDDDAVGLYGAVWKAQTFTPSVAHTITSVKLLLLRIGSPGTITVGIRATVDGHPTGADLCSGTTEGNTLPTGSPYEWREITLGAGYELSADTKYAIVARATGGDVSNQGRWRDDKTSPTYAGGNQEYSGNSGVSWTADATKDQLFEDWGMVAYDRTASVLIGDKVTATRGQTITKTSLTINGIVASASRVYGRTRASAVITGVVATTKRLYLSFTRASSTIIGIVVTASGVAGVYRALVHIGVVVTASRWFPKSYAAAVVVGVVATAARGVAYAASATVIIGIIATTVIRVWGRVRASPVIVGIVAVASRTIRQTRASSVIIGIVVSASRLIAAIRQALTKVGTLVSAFGVAVGKVLKMVVFGRNHKDMVVYTRPHYDMEVRNDLD